MTVVQPVIGLSFVFAARVARFDDFFQLVPDVAERVRCFRRGEVNFFVFVGAHERQKLFSTGIAYERFAQDQCRDAPRLTPDCFY